MLEPTKPGFTGTVWESRPPEQLARDLVSGAGAIPAAEAGLAWGRLSAGFAAAAIEYERILVNLGSAWESKNSGPFIERIRALRDWLSESAGAAAGNATQAEAHAAAYEIARLTMPDAGDVEKLRDMQQMLEQLGTALGAPMLAKIAQADTDADAAKALAARVMRTYEAATDSLATPWEHEQPPAVTAGLTPAEPSAPAEAETPAVETPATTVPQIPLGSIGMPTIMTTYRPTAVEATEATTQRVVTQPVTVQQTSAMTPAGMAGGTQSQEEEHTPRAGLLGANATDAEIDLSAGMQVAPAVLGGLDPNAQGAPVDIAFDAGSAGSEKTSKTVDSGTQGQASA